MEGERVNTKARQLLDAEGKPVGVIWPIAVYRRLIVAIGKGDPDVGRPLKKFFGVALLRQEREHAVSKRGKLRAQVKRKLGLAR